MVVRSTFYNLLGLGLPLAVAVLAMPMLIAELGAERFGILTLIWAVVSYFGLFDLGLGRALTQQLSILLAEERESEITPLTNTSLLILLALGSFAGIVLGLTANFAANQVLYSGDVDEIAKSVVVMGFALPFILVTSGLRGVLEAKGVFGIINLIRLPMGVFTFLGPLGVVLWYRNDLVAVTVVLTFMRIIGCFVHGYFAFKIIPRVTQRRFCNLTAVKNLLIAGGWMTVSNIVSPLMGYLDRFLIGVTVSAAAVAYYVTPNEMITKLWIVPSALTAVLLPKFVVSTVQNDGHASNLFSRAVWMLFVVLFPITLAITLFAREILDLWINPDFAAHSYVALRIFSFGILINCLAHVPFVLIQGAGRAKITAMIHVAEFLPFAVVLWWCASHFGIAGAALAWLCRMLVDTACLFYVARKIVNYPRIKIRDAAAVAGIVAISFLTCFVESAVVRSVALVLSCVAIYFLFPKSFRFITPSRSFCENR